MGPMVSASLRRKDTSSGWLCFHLWVPGQHVPQVDHLRDDTPGPWIPVDTACSRWLSDVQGHGAVGIELHTARIVRSLLLLFSAVPVAVGEAIFRGMPSKVFFYPVRSRSRVF